jgi:hypothetical protein
MTSEDFRQLALSLPDTSEREHMGHPDFRVRGKIFATLRYPSEGWGMVRLRPEDQKSFVLSDPDAFVPVKGGWGQRGCTNVLLKAARRPAVRDALAAAWRNTAPKARGLDWRLRGKRASGKNG